MRDAFKRIIQELVKPLNSNGSTQNMTVKAPTQAELDAMVFGDEAEVNAQIALTNSVMAERVAGGADAAIRRMDEAAEAEGARRRADQLANTQAFLNTVASDVNGAGISVGFGAVAQVSNVVDLLTARGSTHGKFSDNARISQQLKDYYRLQVGYQDLTDIDREALDNIAIKQSRILSGGGTGSRNVDNWDDIAGYATLAANEKRGNAQ